MRSHLAVLLGNRLRLTLRQTSRVREESKLKVAFVSLGAAALWLGLFALFSGLLDGLGRVLDGFGAGAAGGSVLADLLIARLVQIAALALFFMLFASNLAIAHTGLFRSDETRFLLGAPIAPANLYLLRFFEGLLLSSWASAYVASPAILAYGLVSGAPWTYYPAAALLAFGFAVLPAGLALLVTVLSARALALLGRAGRFLAAGTALLAIGLGLRRAVVLPPIDQLSPQALLAGLAAAGHPLLPSTWFSEGLAAAAQGRLTATAFALTLLFSHAALVVWIGTVAAHLGLVRTLTRHAGSARSRRRRGPLAALERVLAFLPQPARALVAKDIRDFWRDPAQWIQFLLFFGLLALYAGNMREQSAVFSAAGWRAWIAVLNVAVCLLVLATLTTRFVFPLVSLEGKRWWLIGLSPVALGTVLRLKQGLAATTSALLTVTLAILSARRLELDAAATLLTVASVLAGTVALSGLAVGLGSLYPNFDEDQPAKIVSGLGGTLNFLLSLVYVAAVTLALALVLRTSDPSLALTAAVGSAILAASAVVAWLPMRLGQRNLERLGF